MGMQPTRFSVRIITDIILSDVADIMMAAPQIFTLATARGKVCVVKSISSRIRNVKIFNRQNMGKTMTVYVE